MAHRDFKDKTVIVTGAGRGLGRALCRRFGDAGARIGGIDIDVETLSSSTDELRSGGVTAAKAACDLADEAATVAAIGQLRDELGPIAVLIANAGITHVRPFGAGEAAAVRRVMDVNFMGAVHATAAAFDDLASRRGLLVAISSVAGFAPVTGRTGYCASKHALEGFCASLRAELCGTGAEVLVVRPSFIATQIQDFGGGRQTYGAQDRPEDVAEQIYVAAQRGRRQIATGLVGRLSYWVYRFAPWFYEAQMRRKMQ